MRDCKGRYGLFDARWVDHNGRRCLVTLITYPTRQQRFYSLLDRVRGVWGNGRRREALAQASVVLAAREAFSPVPD
jgi:hypothetical protein